MKNKRISFTFKKGTGIIYYGEIIQESPFIIIQIDGGGRTLTENINIIKIIDVETKITMTMEKLGEIVEMAFNKGEQWGVTYSTWFTPSKEDKERKVSECFTNCLKEFIVQKNSVKGE